jgi:AraC-like DNA-binding protein
MIAREKKKQPQPHRRRKAAGGGDAMTLQSYATTDVNAGAGVGYWSDVNSRLLVPLDVRPISGETFDATLRIGALGSVGIAESISSPAVIEHSTVHVSRTRARLFTLMLSVEGSMRLSQSGHEMRLAPGDFTLCDSHAPGRISFDEHNRAISLLIPDTLLRRFIPAPEALCEQRIDGNAGLGRVVSRMLPSIWTEVSEGLPAELGDSVARSVLELVATCYALHGQQRLDDAPSAPQAKRVRVSHVKYVLESYLTEPDLGAERVADSLGISRRYVHRLFAAESETVSQYILRRRLEESATQLASPRWRGQTTTQIAVNWGFSSLAHFSRSFRNRFGVSPSEYRSGRR